MRTMRLSKLIHLLLMLASFSISASAAPDDEAELTLYRELKETMEKLGLQNACHESRSDVKYFPLCEEPSQQHRRLEDYYAFEVEEEIMEEEPSEWHFSVVGIFCACLCVLSNSIAAGLTVGLLSLDPLVLMIKTRAGDAQQAAQASVLLPLIQRRHLLLVTLLILNTASSEALPVILKDMAPDFFVIIFSVVLMLFFGEILPSAFFIGKNQLAIAGSMAWAVKCLVCCMYPIAYPISKLLDFVVDHDGVAASNYTRNELAALIRLQYERKLLEKKPELGSPCAGDVFALMRKHSSLSLDEVMIAEGVLAMRSRFAADLVIGHQRIFSISLEADLDEAMIVRIFTSGYSRVPVYRGNNPKAICGILMTRQLILVKATDQKKVSDLALHTPRCVPPRMDLVDLVNLFQTGGGCVGTTRRSAGHMALVCTSPEIGNTALQSEDDLHMPLPFEAGLVGIITMEDVLEALLQEQIYDEMDAAGRKGSLETASSCSSLQRSIHLNASTDTNDYKAMA